MKITKEIPVHLIKIDRFPLEKKSLDYANLMLKGVKFPPIKVAKDKNGSFQIRDGRHRWLATKLIGKTKILAKYNNKCLKYSTWV